VTKLERLLNLTAALLDSEVPLTAERIQLRVGGYPQDKTTFRRMFERDKADLRAMSVPVLVSPSPETDPPIDGYLINRSDYVGADPRFEPDELAALHLATNLVRLEGAERSLVKLGGGAADDRSQIGAIPFDDLLAHLVSAAAARRAVRFTYSAAERTVEPWRLSFAKGRWYLTGWDRLREDDRLFRVDRIDGPLHDVGDAEHAVAATSNPGSLLGWELGDSEPITVVVRIDPDYGSVAHHVFGDVIQAVDGSFEARVQVRNVEALRSAVLTFLDHAEIVSPDEVRNDMVQWLKAQK